MIKVSLNELKWVYIYEDQHISELGSFWIMWSSSLIQSFM